MAPARSARRDDFIQRVTAAAERMGYTDEARLRWLIDFIQRDLSDLREGEWLDLCDDLLVFSLQIPRAASLSALRRLHPVYRKTVDHRSMRVVQRNLRQMVEAMVVVPRTLGDWPIPRTIGRYHLCRDFNGKITQAFVHEGSGKFSYPNAAIAAAINTLTGADRRILRCIECRRVFLAVRRQVYCTSACSQKARTRRFRKAHPRPVGAASSPA